MVSDSISLFINGSRIGLISLLILILAGGIVRSSGSGMGCPDWPKCFNRWVPPTQSSELPQNYKDSYLTKRIKKNNRLAHLMRNLGFIELGNKIEKDPNILIVERFNPFNTWAEYINRLIGMFTGFCFLAVFLFSFPLFFKARAFFWFSGVNLILIFLQAYIGSWVVSTHLLPGLISVHLVLAILILAILIWTLHLSLRFKNEGFLSPVNSVPFLKMVLILSILVGFVQIFLGAQVRESFDSYALSSFTDFQFLKSAGIYFPIHRVFSLLVLGLIGLSSFLVFRHRQFLSVAFVNHVYLNLLLVFIQIGFGISLEIGHLPPFSQALHVFLAIGLFANQLWTLFLYLDRVPENGVLEKGLAL